ncbi:MAG TPA: hypothetical protein VKP58_05945 [Candidatus Acidoferrum sp.]|nr:hypothetical protein [Candidatus Acidoferrum sp.]
MQCKEIEAVLENEGLSPLPESVRAHAASCGACSNLIADFSAIVSAAESLPAEVEPPARVWVALRNQLELEGIIKSPAAEPRSTQPSWLESLSRILSGRAIATVGVALVMVVVAVIQIRHDAAPKQRMDEAAREISAQAPPAPIVMTEPLAETGQTLRQEEQKLPMVRQADFARMDRTDTSLRQNLASLNQFIEECRHRLKEDPNDELAREYLSVAYQQKAELLSAMLDRGRSDN